MPSAPRPTTLTPSRYLVYDEIGTGGMASVFLGCAAGSGSTEELVAIKRLHPHLGRNSKFVAMLLDEADLASRIRHPNVVTVRDVVAVGGEFSLVMEYVRGEVLARLVGSAFERGERIPPAIAVRIALDVLLGLHAAHQTTDEAGRPLCIVHRDVSPQNVMVGTDGRAKVLDFGIAKAERRLQSTRTGETKGKLCYMAPEQLLGQECDRRVDIYATAVMLWEMLVGRRLFSGESDGLLVAQVVAGEVDSPAELVEALPQSLAAVVLRGLAKEPGERYGTAQEMARALESLQPAAPVVVGEWVCALAGEALRQREEVEARIRRQPRQARPENAPSSGASTRPPGVRPRAGVAWAVAIGFALLMWGYQSWTRNGAGVESAYRAAGEPSGSVRRALGGLPSGTTAPAADRSTDPAQPGKLASSPSPATPASVAPVTSKKAVSAGPVSKARPRVSSLSESTLPGCERPYVIDAQGIRRVRRECLTRGANQ